MENNCLCNGVDRNTLMFPLSTRAIQKQLALVCEYLCYEGISTHSSRKWYATEIYRTLLHEMCHYYNDRNGVKDCSRGNTYHNKNFKAVAEACDLVVEHHSTYGWSITSPSDALLEFCVENNLTDIRLNRNDVMSIAVGVGGAHAGTFTGTTGRKPSSTRKYICPCCGMSVRATRNVNVACLDCNEPLVIAA